MINLKKLKPGTLLVVAEHRKFIITSCADDCFDSVYYKLDDQRIMVFLKYQEGIENVKRSSVPGAAARTSSPFIVKIQVLYKEKKFWLLTKETRNDIQDLPDDLKEDFRLCGWIDILESED